MNKLRGFYFISLLIIYSSYIVFVWAAGADTNEGLYSIVINNITSGSNLLNKLNITTGVNLNFTCTAERSNNFSGGAGSAAVISNISFYHNFNTTNIGLNMTNTTNSTSSYYILQQNSSLTSLSTLFKIENGTIIYNANGGWTGTSTLSDGNFTIACAAATNNTGTFNYSANITLTIDRIQPNFSLLNITDGTKTVLQTKLNGTSTVGPNAYLVNRTNLTVSVTITEPNVDTVWLFWTTNNTLVNISEYATRNNLNNLTLNKIVEPSSSKNESVWNGSFLTGGVSGDRINLGLLNDGTTINFMIITNDSAGNIKNFSNGGTGFNITLDGTIPQFNLSSNSLFNVTDGTTTLGLNKLNSTLQGGSPVYLKNDSSLNFRVTITEPNVDKVTLFWSSNGTPVTLNEYATRNNPRNLTLNRLVTQTGVNGNNSVWNGSFLFGGNSSTAFSYQDNIVINFMLVVNDTAGNIRNLTNNGAGFNFTLDGLPPLISSFTLDKTRLATLNAIKATCETNDTSPVAYTIKLTKPDGATVTKNPLDGKSTFTSLETGAAGKYTVECTVEDTVNLKTTKTLEFSAFFEGEDLGISEAEEVEKVAEVDLGRKVGEAIPEHIISGIQGESTTFTLDRVISHTLTFLEVGDTEVTLRFESTPVDVKLKIGETKPVDINQDGKNDVVVTLNSITEGNVNVIIKASEEVLPISSEEPDTTSSTETQKSGRTEMVLLVIVILAVIVAAYFLLKGKKLKSYIKNK